MHSDEHVFFSSGYNPRRVVLQRERMRMTTRKRKRSKVSGRFRDALSIARRFRSGGP